MTIDKFKVEYSKYYELAENDTVASLTKEPINVNDYIIPYISEVDRYKVKLILSEYCAENNIIDILEDKFFAVNLNKISPKEYLDNSHYLSHGIIPPEFKEKYDL